MLDVGEVGVGDLARRVSHPLAVDDSGAAVVSVRREVQRVLVAVGSHPLLKVRVVRVPIAVRHRVRRGVGRTRLAPLVDHAEVPEVRRLEVARGPQGVLVRVGVLVVDVLDLAVGAGEQARQAVAHEDDVLAVRWRGGIGVEHGLGLEQAVMHVRAGLDGAGVPTGDGTLEVANVVCGQRGEVLLDVAVALERHDAHAHLVDALHLVDEAVERVGGAGDGGVPAAGVVDDEDDVGGHHGLGARKLERDLGGLALLEPLRRLGLGDLPAASGIWVARRR